MPSVSGSQIKTESLIQTTPLYVFDSLKEPSRKNNLSGDGSTLEALYFYESLKTQSLVCATLVTLYDLIHLKTEPVHKSPESLVWAAHVALKVSNLLKRTSS